MWDPHTKRSKGFGFVTFTKLEDAGRAISGGLPACSDRVSLPLSALLYSSIAACQYSSLRFSPSCILWCHVKQSTHSALSLQS